MNERGLYWFGSDLRTADNSLLCRAAAECGALACVYVLDQRWLASNRYQLRGMGAQRQRFLFETLADLRRQLAAQGQTLWVFSGNPEKVIAALVAQLQPTVIYRGEQVGWDEWRQWRALVHQSAPSLQWRSGWQHTLLQPAQLPFAIEQLPSSFTQFRRRVEPLAAATLVATAQLPPPLAPDSVAAQVAAASAAQLVDLVAPAVATSDDFNGGSAAAHRHLDGYFASELASSYKQTRNALSDWSSSTKFSPWLALGAISPRQVAAAVAAYEQRCGANDSTYWIIFELLWRDYFQFYAYRYGAKLFAFGGIRQQPPLTSFYPQRFAAWCHGRSAYPLVNAAMNELRETGYLSNRLRQIVASCLVNELQLDWRYGAAFFEQQLLDYDVASNWGNWQYIAGVGADPRGGRHFSIEKQTALYDPRGEYIARWRGELGRSYGDAVDQVDWPRQLH